MTTSTSFDSRRAIVTCRGPDPMYVIASARTGSLELKFMTQTSDIDLPSP
ncbi:hypothetical protein [Embleya sp. NBC_00896]|nr:hypothetical protein OG928_47900 [Embleya sp. NBC_00896]